MATQGFTNGDLMVPAPPRWRRRPLDQALLIRLGPLVALFYTFFLFPPEVALNVAGLNLPAYRLVLIGLSLLLIARLFRGAPSELAFADICVGLVAVWVISSFVVNYGFLQGATSGFGAVIDMVGSYALARTSVRDFDDLRYFMLLSLPGILFAALILTVESVSGQLLYRPAFAAVFGNTSFYSAGETAGQLILREEFRLGFLRAYGPFSHPILGGLLMAGFLPLFYFSKLRSWPFWGGIAASVAAVFSLSSAALLALLVGASSIVIHHVKSLLPRISWWTILAMIGLMTFTVHVISQNGIVAVLGRYTLAPHTAAYRTLIWEFGSKTVAENPWFGIGYKSWERLAWMGESVDAHFLLLAMRHGLLVPIVLMIALIFVVAKLGINSRYLRSYDRSLALGLNATMVIYLIAAQTVAFFGSAHLAFMAIFGITASIAHFAGRVGDRTERLRLMAMQQDVPYLLDKSLIAAEGAERDQQPSPRPSGA